MPDAAFAGGSDSLRKSLIRTAMFLRRAILMACLGKTSQGEGPGITRRTQQGRISVLVRQRSTLNTPFVCADDEWIITPKGRNSVEGRGLLDLLAAVYAVPAGIAAVRLFEATTGADLDATAAGDLAAVVDAWHARGRPGSASGSWSRA